MMPNTRRLLDASFDWPVVFPWLHGESTIWKDFRAIQAAAAIHLSCSGKHRCTPACHAYGFHDLRRASFGATQNASRLSGDALQSLMRHKSYATTKNYINYARQLDDAVDRLHVPEVLRAD